MNKRCVVINGSGASGKDTVVAISSYLTKWQIYSFSSVSIVKKAAEILGWRGKKNKTDRKFLSDLKQLSINYNNQPNEYLVYSAEKMPENSLGFVFIREPKEIDVFKSSLVIDVDTLLVKRYTKEHGNDSDDLVENYHYDYVIDNSGTLEELVIEVNYFLNWIGVETNENRCIKMCNTASRVIGSSNISH